MNRNVGAVDEMLYTDAMIHEEWLISPDGIAFDTDNVLLNGQHRLRACISSGKPFDAFVMRNLPPRSRLVTDDGKKRKFAEDLQMHGIPLSNQLEALLRKVMQWEDLKGIPLRGSGRVPRLTLDRRFAGRKTELLHAINVAGKHGRTPFNRGTKEFITWLLLKYGPERMVDNFLSVLSIGSQFPEDQPLVRLREKFEHDNIEFARTGRKARTSENVYFLIVAWNKWVTKQRMAAYRLPDGGLKLPFPAPMKVEEA